MPKDKPPQAPPVDEEKIRKIQKLERLIAHTTRKLEGQKADVKETKKLLDTTMTALMKEIQTINQTEMKFSSDGAAVGTQKQITERSVA